MLFLKSCCIFRSYLCKNRRPYNLYCVGADVKPCSINQLWSANCYLFIRCESRV